MCLRRIIVHVKQTLEQKSASQQLAENLYAQTSISSKIWPNCDCFAAPTLILRARRARDNKRAIKTKLLLLCRYVLESHLKTFSTQCMRLSSLPRRL